MPCTFNKGQEVRGIGTGQTHIITDIRRDPPRPVLAGWGSAIVEDVYIQVDNQVDSHGKPLWQGWGNFEEVY